jgi:hypothetical protein
MCNDIHQNSDLKMVTFCCPTLYLHHLTNHRLPDRPLVIMKKIRSHFISPVLGVAKNSEIHVVVPHSTL